MSSSATDVDGASADGAGDVELVDIRVDPTPGTDDTQAGGGAAVKDGFDTELDPKESSTDNLPEQQTVSQTSPQVNTR